MTKRFAQHYSLRQSDTGFTLIETIVALALIVGAMAGPFTLATRGVFASKFSKNKLVALNLAQEGVEIIRSYRDNNILKTKIDPFDARLWDDSIGIPNEVTDWSYDVYDCPAVLPCTPAEVSGLHQCTVPCTALLRDSNGLYSNVGTPTVPSFTRTIRIDKTNFSEADLPLPAVPQSDRMKVTAIVEWTESGIPRRVEIEDVLYAWK